MTDNTQNNQHADPRKQERLKWQAAVAIPAYGVLRIDTVTNDLFSAVKPDGASGLYYVNDHVAVPINGYGSSLEWVRAQPVMFEPAAVVAVGDACGPVNGQWYMSSDESGWNVFIPPNADDIAFVVKAGGSGGSGSPIMIGPTVNPVCAAATIDIETDDATYSYFTGGCADIPDAYGGVISCIDPLRIMSAYADETELEGLDADGVPVMGVALYTHPISDCENGVWVLLAISGISEC